MRRFFCLICAFMMCLPCFLMVGCKDEKKQESKILRVCNCEDYIDESLLEDFYKETKIQVIYSTYGTNENLYNELVINPNSYDLVVPSEYMIEKLAKEGRIQKLDYSKLEDYNNNISPYIKSRLNDLRFVVSDGKYKGEEVSINEFMVGYMWGTMGWVYNTDVVDYETVSSWNGVFENQELNGRITIKDAVRDSYIVGLGMVYEDELKLQEDNAKITEILNRTDKEAINKVGEKLNQIRPMLYGFEVDSGKNDIVLGNIDAYVAWSGDAAYAIDVASGEVEDEDGSFVKNIRNLSYSIPKEGSNIWFDGFVMPSGSSNYDAVYKFLEFISRPSSVYRNMDYTGYTSMIARGELDLEVENEDGTISSYKTNLFDEVVLGWFDESEDVEPGMGVEVDLSYFFGEGDYKVVVSEEGYGRLIAQYPTLTEVSRCAIMNNFDSDTLMEINDMWEGVKGETFDWWLIILFLSLIVVLAIFLVLYRNKGKIKWFRLPTVKRKTMADKGYTEVKRENIN